MTTATLVPVHMLPHRTPRELLTLARHGLAEAAAMNASGQRYAAAHLAALRAAAALLAARARPAAAGSRSRVTSVWGLLTLVAPEFREWTDFFAAGAAKRSAAEAGIARVTPDEADSLLVQAGRFVGLVQEALGLPSYH